MTESGQREFLVVAHTGREIVTDTIAAITRHCVGAGIGLRVVEHDISGGYHGQRWIGPTAHPVDPARLRGMGADVAIASGDEESAAGCELVIVLGVTAPSSVRPNSPIPQAHPSSASTSGTSVSSPRPRRTGSTR